MNEDNKIPVTYMGMDHSGLDLEQGKERQWLVRHAPSLSDAVRFAADRCTGDDPYSKDTKHKLEKLAGTLAAFAEGTFEELTKELKEGQVAGDGVPGLNNNAREGRKRGQDGRHTEEH